MSMCETCAYYYYDEEFDEYVCDAEMDEDDMARLVQGKFRQCPFWRDGDEYKVVRHQL